MKTIMKLLAKVRWEWIVRLYKKPSYVVSDPLKANEIKRYLSKGYYQIAVFDPYALSTYFVCVVSWLLTGKWPEYTHLLQNVEPEDAAHDDFRFTESTSLGYQYANFEKALGHAKRIAFLTPRYYTQEQVDATLAIAYENIGCGYDFKFNIKDSKELSCVEAVWYRLQKLPFSDDNFRCLKMLMEWEGNLTPEMFFCPDFKVVKEWRA